MGRFALRILGLTKALLGGSFPLEQSGGKIAEPLPASPIVGGLNRGSFWVNPLKLPSVMPGLRVGLFGGSFNPPHEGHKAASLLALKRLKLDRVWWLVSPGNPLKDSGELAPFARRLDAARRLANHPRIEVTGIEAAIGAAYSFETICYLKRRCPGVHFVWVMGADNFRDFDRWQRWREIATILPIAVIDRPGFTSKAFRGRAAVALAPYRRSESCASALAAAAPPAFVFLHGPRSPFSSTQLRGKPLPGGAGDQLNTK